VIVLRRVAPQQRGRLPVGKRVGPWVEERFLTTVPATRLLAADVLDLDRGRGGVRTRLPPKIKKPIRIAGARTPAEGRNAGRSWPP
jgi:hypothetical protein